MLENISDQTQKPYKVYDESRVITFADEGLKNMIHRLDGH